MSFSLPWSVSLYKLAFPCDYIETTGNQVSVSYMILCRGRPFMAIFMCISKLFTYQCVFLALFKCNYFHVLLINEFYRVDWSPTFIVCLHNWNEFAGVHNNIENAKFMAIEKASLCHAFKGLYLWNWYPLITHNKNTFVMWDHFDQEGLNLSL